jgi:hypothetical protein
VAIDDLDSSHRIHPLRARNLLANPKIFAMGSMLAVAFGISKAGFASGFRFTNSASNSAK